MLLCRPPRDDIIRKVAQLSRNRDPTAPKGLTDGERRTLCKDEYLLALRKKKVDLRKEMLLSGLEGSKSCDIYKRRQELTKKIARRRDELSTKAWQKVRMSHYESGPALEIARQINLLLGVKPEEETTDPEREWLPPAPVYSSDEHERVGQEFFGSKVDGVPRAEEHTQRVQVIEDLIVLSGLREPPKRGPRIQWAKLDPPLDPGQADDLVPHGDESVKAEEVSPAPKLLFANDQCMFCAGDITLRTFCPRAKQRPDALRRHLENQHLSRFSPTDSVTCPHPACQADNAQPLQNRAAWLNHAAKAHSYDLKVQLSRLGD